MMELTDNQIRSMAKEAKQTVQIPEEKYSSSIDSPDAIVLPINDPNSHDSLMKLHLEKKFGEKCHRIVIDPSVDFNK